MFKRLASLWIACAPLLGCSHPAPPTPRSSVENRQPRLEFVSYLPDDKNIHGFLCRPNDSGRYPALVLVHDFMGLTDGVKDDAYRLARAGHVVLAVNLYRSEAARTAKEGERLASALPKQRALADLKAAVDYLTQRPDVRRKSPTAGANGKEWWDLGVLGLGSGGGYALDAALDDRRLRALVLCYAPLPTEAKRLTSLNASVFCVLAGNDKRVTADVITKFCQAMEEVGKRVAGLRVYGDRQPGFLDPATRTTPTRESTALEETDVEDAWKLIAEYLNRELS